MDPDLKFGKKRPPKLKNTDRTISITIDNYKPPAPIIIDGNEMILEESSRHMAPHTAPLNYEYTVIGEASGALSAPNSKANIFYLDPGSSSRPTMGYDDDTNNHLLIPQQYASSSRRNSFRRSDTLDVCGPALMQLRKTRSFHSNEPLLMPPTEDLLLVRRTSNSSNRSSQPERSPMSDRRNCSTHRSFNDIVKQRLVARKIAAKCHSFSESVFQQMGDSEADDSQMEADNEMFDGEVVIERDRSLDRDGSGGEVIIRSRSNSRNLLQLPLSSLDDEIIIDYSPRSQVRSQSMKKNHNSMSELQHHQQQQQQQQAQQQQHQPHQAFRRGVRQAQSFYLSPHSYDELRVTRSSPRSQNAENRKVYSSSVKYKEEKKQPLPHGRSFIADMLPVPKMVEFEAGGSSSGVGGGGRVSPYSWENTNRCYTADEQLGLATKIAIQRSPRLSSQSIKLSGSNSGGSRAFERRTSSLGYDISPGANSNSNISLIHSANNTTSQMDLDNYDAVIRAFQRKSPRKGSLGSSGRAGSASSRGMSVRKKPSEVEIMQGVDGIEIGAALPAIIGVAGSGKLKKPLSTEVDEEQLRKRRRIICIITTVFFTLVIASVCVVVVMLAHTSGYSQVANQSKKYSARGSPIHHYNNKDSK